MIIDKDNFEKELPNVIEAIQKVNKLMIKSDFIAFDLEMSGIKTDEKINQLDLPGEHYYKVSPT